MMRRCTPFCLRNLSYNDLKGFVYARECHEHISSSFGTWAVCLSMESNVLECEDERLVDAFQIPQDRSLLLKSSDFGTSQQALELVEQGFSQHNPLFYDRWLKRCMELGDLRVGRIVHANVIASEVKDDIIILNNIIKMYAKCGNLGEARKCFNEMTYKDSFTWTTMIIAYTQNGRPEEGLSLLPKMFCLGLKPNKFTFSSLLKASKAICSAKHGMQIHTLCIKYGCDSNVYVGTSLVDLYARCGLMNESQSIFDGLVSKNEVSWNALIAGHARKERGEEALSLFQRMKREDFEPNDFTYSSVLNACASTGVLEQGKRIHAHVIKCGVKLIAFVGHTLLHMYAKCGSIDDAEKVFTRLTERDVVSWNSMLTGYAQHGFVHKSLEQFDNMLKTGIQPNAITFLCLLTSCSHAGFVEQGQYYFKIMKTYGLEPKIEHYVTIVDLLGRAGKLDQALRFIRDMPIDPAAEIWKCLLGACRMHRNMDLGVYAAERVFELDPYDSGPYVILANMYALAGRRSDVAKVRKMMKDGRVRKEPACSWVEIENSVHVFVADDDTHPQSKEIYEMWESISAKIKEIGYVPDTSQVLLFVEEHEREVKLQHHSEKLALAFACLNMPPKSTIRIKKNIRMGEYSHQTHGRTHRVKVYSLNRFCQMDLAGGIMKLKQSPNRTFGHTRFHLLYGFLMKNCSLHRAGTARTWKSGISSLSVLYEYMFIMGLRDQSDHIIVSSVAAARKLQKAWSCFFQHSSSLSTFFKMINGEYVKHSELEDKVCFPKICLNLCCSKVADIMYEPVEYMLYRKAQIMLCFVFWEMEL